MSLESFLRGCEKKGAIPLSYRSHKEFADGSEDVEFENPSYKKARERIERILGRDGHANDNFSGLYGEAVMIRTREGYHYGILKGFNGKTFRLENYLFDEDKLDMMGYYTSFFPSFDDTVVPAKDIISVSRIPAIIEKRYSFV